MALWRNRDLEDILGGKLEQGEITEAGLRKLVGEIPAEDEFVEYKSRAEFDKLDKSGDWNAKQERAKDVSAAANGRGAILVYGIEDIAKPKFPDRVNPFDAADDRHRRIEQFRKDIRQQATPTPLFDMFAVDADSGGFYLVVVIPPSSSAPHAVMAQTGQSREALHYFVRAPGETQIRYLKEHEIADRYSVRHRRQEDRARHAAAVWSEGRAELTWGQKAPVWLAVSVVPDVPVDGQLTPQVRDEMRAWDDVQYYPDSVLVIRDLNFEYPFPAPGKMVYTSLIREESGTKIPRAVDSYRELHADGSAYAALLLGAGGESGVVKLDADPLIDAVVSLITHTLNWTTARAGRWGNATVQIGFVVGTNSRDWSPALQLEGTAGETAHGLRRACGEKTATTLADLATLHTMQDKLRVAYSAALPIFQGFGVIQPAWITNEGALRKPLLPPQSNALRWAAQHGVEVDQSALA